ncbi:IclR family transcriptional regulator [Halorubrum persicum]|nr:IclR family transcriptional regulator [Halorubrum persicum]
METDDAPVIESSQKLFQVLEQVIEKEGGGVTEIADETSLAKSTTHLHLQSLLATGYVVKRDGQYYPSLQLFEWGEKVRNGIEVYVKGRGEVDELITNVRGVAKLGVLEGDSVRLAYVKERADDATESSAQSISTEFNADTPTVMDHTGEYRNLLGKEMNIHATAIGKAVLAEMSRDTVESIVDHHGLPQYTENTITDESALFDELDRIRERGYAIDSEEWAADISCIGAAITRKDRPVGGVSISGPNGYVDGNLVDEIARRVINTTNMIEVKLTHGR